MFNKLETSLLVKKPETLIAFAEAGGDVDACKGPFGLHLLHSMAMYDMPDMIRLLGKYTTNPNVLTSFKSTAFHFAVILDNARSVLELLILGTDPYIKNCFGESPLKMAIRLASEKPNSIRTIALLSIATQSWSPETHRYYTPDTGSTVAVAMQCFWRRNFPEDVALMMLSYCRFQKDWVRIGRKVFLSPHVLQNEDWEHSGGNDVVQQID